MVKFGIQLALVGENHVSAKASSKGTDVFKCVICEKELSLRAGSKTPKHFIHKRKSSCVGNNDGHREQAESLGSTGEKDTRDSSIEPEQATSNGSIDENQDQISKVEPEQATSNGSIDENQDQISKVEPEEVSPNGSMDENQDQISKVEPEEVSPNGSMDENQDQISKVEPMNISDESVDQVLSELIPIDSIVEPVEVVESSIENEPEDPGVPDIEEAGTEHEHTVTEEISNSIINEALEVVEGIIEPHKCCSCKKKGSDFHQMFSSESRERFGLNDLYVCSSPSCFVECPHCSMPNSRKRHKKFNMCFLCNFLQCEFIEEATEAVKKMRPIPDAPTWLKGRRAIFVIKMLKRKIKARIVYNFMWNNKSRIQEFKVQWAEEMKARKIAKQIKKVRKASEKTRKMNQQRRDAMMGTDGASRYKAMYANRRETCSSCGKQNKRRFYVQYESVMGSMKYACKGCIKVCSGCSKETTQHDMDRFGNQCFSCYAWKCTRSDEWKTNQKAVLDACLEGQKWAWGVLYLNAPGVTKGKYAGDSITHVGSGDIGSVIRRDHPEMSEISRVIKECRKM